MAHSSQRTVRSLPVLPLLVLVYVAVACAMLAAWGAGTRSLAAGDEPHYLVLSDAVVHDRSLSPESAYVRAFAEGLDASQPLPSRERVLAGNAIHLVHGPHGWYSVHGVGLAVLIAPGAAVGDEFAARLTVVALGVLVLVLLWWMAPHFVTDPRLRPWVVLPLGLGFPVLVGSTQLYPDLPGGAMCLVGLLGVVWAQQGASMRRLVVTTAAVATLPWLHLRFALPAVVLTLAVAAADMRRTRSQRRAAVLLVPLAVSAVTLAVYHQWAFGHMTGPYGDEAAAVGWRSVMVFIGLGVDQNQGLFVQQPLHLVGLFFLVAFFRSNRLLASTVVAVMLLILVPSAVHPAWYGGPTFSGRFGWAPSLVFMPATLFGLGRLASTARRAAVAILAVGAAVQVWYLALAARGTQRLYQRPDTTPLGEYSMHFGVLGRWLPALYDTDSALGHVPNAIAVLALVWIVVLGAGWGRRVAA